MKRDKYLFSVLASSVTSNLICTEFLIDMHVSKSFVFHCLLKNIPRTHTIKKCVILINKNQFVTNLDVRYLDKKKV